MPRHIEVDDRRNHPESIETELLNHDDVVTFDDVIAFCKKAHLPP